MKSHNKSYESMFNQIKATYFLHILEGQASGFHTLISLLNSYKNLQFLIFWGTRAHILGPRNLTDWNLHEDLYVRSVSNPILFGVSGVAYFIWEEGGGGGGVMTMEWNLAHIEAMICEVKIDCQFSKWQIIFDEASTT